MTKVLVTPAYSCRRLNSSTFLVIHDDKYEEYPFIYIKLFNEPALAVLIDTGCGSAAAKDPSSRLTDLCEYIETFPITDNDSQPLNPRTKQDGGSLIGQREYLIICSHVHYDHIGGIESFPSNRTTIVASGFDKDFLSRENRARNSLCPTIPMPLPEYTISHFAKDMEWLQYRSYPLSLQILHTPGHTPDSLAVWDAHERCLFVGDSFYYRNCNLPDQGNFTQPIVFPPQGNWTNFMESLDKLSSHMSRVLRGVENNCEMKNASIACGHTTQGATAKILNETSSFFEAVIKGKVCIKFRTHKNGEEYLLWQEEGEPLFSLFAPERLLREYQRSLTTEKR